MKYLERISCTSEQKDVNNKKLMDKESKLAFDSQQLEIEKKISRAERELDQLKSAEPIEPFKVYEADKKLRLLQDELKFYKECIVELW